MKRPKPGAYSLDHLPNYSAIALQGLSDDDLLKFIGGWKEGHEHRIAGMRELARRDQQSTARRAQRALIISSASLAVAVAGFILAMFRG